MAAVLRVGSFDVNPLALGLPKARAPAVYWGPRTRRMHGGYHHRRLRRVGSQLANMLSKSDNNVTVIDRTASAFANLGSDFNGATIQGVGFDEDVLARAGIEDCDVVASVTQLDNTNLMVARWPTSSITCPMVARGMHNWP